MSESDVLMGELRSLLAQKPSKKTWLALCAVLDRWPADELARRDEEALPYCQDHLLGWGARISTRPPNPWIKRWFGGDPTVVELMGLGYLNSARAPDSGRSPRQRCSYYTIWTRDVSWVSNNLDACDVYESTTHTADRAAVERAVWNQAEGMRHGTSALWQHLSTDGHMEQATDEVKISFFLNGMEIGRSLLMPDLTVTEGGKTIRLVASRPTALGDFLHSTTRWWPGAMTSALVYLQDADGEELWRGALDDVGRAEPWREVLGRWFRPDPRHITVDTAPLLCELPQLPAFNRLPEQIHKRTERRFGY